MRVSYAHWFQLINQSQAFLFPFFFPLSIGNNYGLVARGGLLLLGWALPHRRCFILFLFFCFFFPVFLIPQNNHVFPLIVRTDGCYMRLRWLQRLISHTWTSTRRSWGRSVPPNIRFQYERCLSRTNYPSSQERRRCSPGLTSISLRDHWHPIGRLVTSACSHCGQQDRQTDTPPQKKPVEHVRASREKAVMAD